MRNPLFPIAVGLAVVAGAAGAQQPEPSRRWSVGISVGVSSFSPASEGSDADGVRLALFPYRPTMWGAFAGYGRGGKRLHLSVRYGSAGLGARGVSLGEEGGEGGNALVVARDAYHLTTLSAGVSNHLVRLRGGPTLRPSLGLDAEHWAGVGSPGRWIMGGHGGLALEIALTRALFASLEGEIGLTPASPFRHEDLPDGFDQRTVWRRTLSAAVVWRP